MLRTERTDTRRMLGRIGLPASLGALLVLALVGCGGSATHGASQVSSSAGTTTTTTSHPAPSSHLTSSSRVTAPSAHRSPKPRPHARSAYPKSAPLGNDVVAYWTVVLAQTVARKRPSASSPAVATVGTKTGDGTDNVLLVIGETQVSPGQTWYKVRLAILPNNSVGYVPSTALGRLYTVFTHLYVDRETMTATLKRSGVTIFSARVGVGKSYWPTPAGQFYIRDELTDFNDSFYGPVAFGTSARSAVLTDWPGGGFVGVHGTNEPQILPGQVSHGCIRMRNSSILQLAKLMPVGTPLTVT
jgi:lipoprotein-anchoring transpeptidase ErfK/SrfK